MHGNDGVRRQTVSDIATGLPTCHTINTLSLHLHVRHLRMAVT